jgi:hypothetical protein
MILMAPCIIDFIEAMHYLGQWGEGALDTPGPIKWYRTKLVPFGSRSVQGGRAPPPPPAPE